MSSKEKNQMDILNDVINSQEQVELRSTVSPSPKSKNIDEMTCEEKLAHYMKMHDEQMIVLKEKEELLILTREELDMLNKQLENLYIELWGKEQDYNELFREYKKLESNYKKLQVNHLGNLYTDIAKSDDPNKSNKRMRTGGRRKRKKTRNKRKRKQKKSRRK